MIDIVIVNWNAGDQLQDLMNSIVHFHYNIVKSVVIVDNASVDNSIADLEKAFKTTPFRLNIIRNQINLGFGVACNQGAAQCHSEYLLFLNPDSVLYQDTLQVAFKYMAYDNNKDVGICGVQLIDEHNHISLSCANFPKPVTFILHSFGLNRLKRLSAYSLHMHNWDHSQTRVVDHVIGAFYLIRTSLFNDLNGFDPRFFVYLEDLDLSLRAKEQGWKSVYLTEAKAFHVGGGTSNQVKATRLFYSLRSRLLYSAKHFTMVGASMVFITTLLIEPIFRLGLAILKLSNAQIRETTIGFVKLYRWVPKWMLDGKTN
jgi:GT2 family glycosyltransferase